MSQNTTSTNTSITENGHDDNMDTTATENEVKTLFHNKTESERAGNSYETTSCYKRALKLDLDVETATEVIDTYKKVKNDLSEDEYDYKEDLFLRFQRLMGLPLCFPENSQQMTHFSKLPSEIVFYIFRWVVSSDLDLRTLEKCSAVCRGWYLLARDSDIWRRACSRFWISNVNDLIPYNDSWRRMFLERPHPLLNGCYVCKILYVHRRTSPGEYEAFFRGFSTLVYFRYLRFFPDGRVLMLMSYKLPAKVISKLNTKQEVPNNTCPGYYKLLGDHLILTVNDLDSYEKFYGPDYIGFGKNITSYNMIYKIKKYKSKPNWKLICTSYEVCTRKTDNRIGIRRYNLTEKGFPPFVFSPVNSYTNKFKRIL